VLSEEEKGFNHLYGRDVTIEDIIYSQTLSMMAERQVVIVKEAQDLSRTIDKLESYADNQWPRFSDLLQVQNIR
jgi:DNA polymerase-3 subunit delta